MDWEGFKQAVLGAGTNITAGILSIILWELIKTFGPEGLYDRFTKWQRKIRFRNKIYPISTMKTFESTLKEDFDLKFVRETAESLLKEAFSSYNLEFVNSRDEYKIEANIQRSGFDFRVAVEIEPPEECSEEVIRLIVIQKAKIKFKSIERALNLMFWNLVELAQKFLKNSIEQASENVKVEVQSEDIKLFLEILDKLSLNQITGTNLTIAKRDKQAVVKIEDKMSPELAKKIRELVVLGHL